ncbi:helix-turn-helix domain-containing protein [Chroogloeocystis siderophila]|uniref:Transposase n=1 Tax=Chroogloeocystis siderophila 5.2 s.c.1 TaxID=247279 RepID=A0A1U7HS85_9CHRO|nr:helix-turn-helix domain-containing protein [Chroogloeocystis siderophila]OKH26442.1 transposase [Chroogloeocystis siderophila 5.2 s.c.1]
MAGVYKLEIEESEEDFKQLLRGQKTASAKERIQLLYLLKTKQAETVQAAALLLGRHRGTLQEWLRSYREGGIDGLLKRKARSGRPRAIPDWAEDSLLKRLQQRQGFDGYKAICDWLENALGLAAKYKTVHKLVHYRLQASPKVPRPVSGKQSLQQKEAYKKT